MNKKEILIIFMILCCIFSLHAVAASSDLDDSGADVLSAENISTTSLPDCDEILRSDDVGTFSELQDDIQGESDVTLTRNYTYNVGGDTITQGITISNDITIRGKNNDVTIDAKGKTRIFNVDNSNAHVTLIGITFVNGNGFGNNGGAILSTGKLSIYNCTFKDNTVSGEGGAVYASASRNLIVNSTFIGNGATGSKKNGGALNLGTYSTVSNSTFIANHATGNDNNGGGAIFAGDHATINKHCYFVNNTVGTDGGSITVGNNADISNVTVINSTSGARAGGIRIGDASVISDSLIKNSKGVTYGGAVSAGTGCEFYNTVFDSNYLSDAGSSGGAINSRSNNYIKFISNCTFINNSAKEGGAIRSSRISIVDSRFINNSAYNGVAGAIYIASNGGHNLTLNNCNFTGNNATSNGGAIESALPIYANGCNFTDNYAGAVAGAIYMEPSKDLFIDNSYFINNHAKTEGGAIKGYYVSIKNADFVGNNASNMGGAISSTANLVIYDATFTNNHVTANSNGGGAVYTTGNVNIYNSNLTRNSANSHGGAIRASVFTVDNCNFTDNHANGNNKYGGALYITGASSIVSKSIFNNNTATTNGGAIYWEGASGSVSYSNFTNNSAVSGGAIYWHSSSSSISYSNFTLNRATNGGAIYTLSAITTFSYLNLNKNVALTNGGAIYVSGSTSGGYATTVTKSNFTGNNATNGGGIYSTSGTSNTEISYPLEISDSSFDFNHATNEGGAVYFGFINSKIINSNFANNTAATGGAVVIAHDNQLLTGLIFTNNSATSKGGSVYVKKVTNGDIKNSTFKNSYAYDGGAVYNVGSIGVSILIDNCTFIKNIASHNGGATYYIVDAGTNAKIYRDYEDFDGQGEKDGDRTSVYMKNSQGTPFRYGITSSLFKDNLDYLLNISAKSMDNVRGGVVSLYDPKDVNKDNFRIVINLTIDGVVIANQTINSSNYVPFFNIDQSSFNVNFYNLTFQQEYNVTVEFYDDVYLTKTLNTSFVVSVNVTMGDFEIIQMLIEDALGKNENNITLTRNYEYSAIDIQNETGCINITAPTSFTIYGNGYSINAKNYCRIFNITSSNVTLNTITLSGGNAAGVHGDEIRNGGGIYWSGVNGTMVNVNFDNNRAVYGGGLYLNESALNSKIRGCTFSNNNATKNGGAIDCNAPEMNLTNTLFESNWADTGAALCREKTATGGFGMSNTFIRNHALSNGSALAWINASSININYYNFTDNTAGYSGGAIYVGEGSIRCIVNNSYFRGNNITSQLSGHGGAIEWYANNGYILSTTFINNNAYQGGALFVGDESKEINVLDSVFIGNNAYNNGGAINVEGSNVTLNRSRFDGNTALEGGALFVGGQGEDNYVYLSSFTANNATVGRGGAIAWVVSAGHIIDSNFTNNSAIYGGGVYVGGNSDYSRMVNVSFTGNNATKNGGAIDWNAKGGQLYNTTFTSNYAGEYGAALCRESGATGGSGGNNTFIRNHAGIAGAALGWINVNNITIRFYTFTDNTADHSGGAIYIGPGSDNCKVYNCTFTGNNITNETGGHGGAIDIVADNATIINTTFENNNAFYGGAIFVGSASGRTIITNDTFTRNNANASGGAIHLQASGVDVNKTKFYANSAINGSALYVGGEGTNNTVHSSLFKDNIAEGGYGAGIYWRARAGNIEYTNFTNNKAMYGGGIYLNGVSSNTNITHVIFTYNNATKNGGAIDCNSSKMGLYYTLFENNYAGEYGAALCREVNATSGHGHHNTFNYNHAGIGGAALAWMGVENININYYNFTGNTANQRGGAIYVHLGSNYCVVNNSRFIGNNVTNNTIGFGGAIDINANNATIINSYFEDNHAHYGGAVTAGETSGHTTIRNVTFTTNGAFIDGGAVNLRASGVAMNDTRFYSNVAARNGGAIYVGGTGTNNTIHHSIFRDNDAKGTNNESGIAGGHGGAIDWRAAAGEIIDSEFTHNTAIYGGGIYLNGISTQSKISHVIFTSNTASENGGAIDCNATKMNLTHTQFISNYAKYGAALCRESGATGGFGGNNTFDSNHAYISGAALAWMNVSNIRINNYTFTNNTADVSGAAIFVDVESDNCKVFNSTFKDNFVTNMINGRGGAIEWLGNNGTVANTTFYRCISANGGAIYVGIESDNMTVTNSTFVLCKSLSDGGALVLYGDDVTIALSNFTSCIAMENGGAIAGFDSNNANITGSYFKYNIASGYTDPDGNAYGEGGAIYFEDSNNLKVSDSKFISNEAHLSGGSISAINCNDSVVYNINTFDETAFRNGGSISWINSSNLTIEKSYFNDSGASYHGGSIYLYNVNATIKNTTLNSTWASWGVGGGLYVCGNVTLNNVTFNDTHSYQNNATAIYFEAGNSTVVNSTFTNSFNAINIGNTTGKPATVYLTNNTLKADNPNKNVYYIEKYDSKYNPVDYSVWNDGNLYLKDNNFDYIIFNNGTIWTKTTTKLMGNETRNVTWNENYTFWAHIYDDNLNTIISVNSLNTSNQVYQTATNSFILPYNCINLQCSYQGSFKLKPFDANLKDNDCYNGTLNVKMPVQMEITHVDLIDSNVRITATLTPEARSNYTIKGEKLFFNLDGNPYMIDGIVINDVNEQTQEIFTTWTKATVTFDLTDLTSGTHTLTGTFNGDIVHLKVENISRFNVNARLSWINMVIENATWGENATIVITTNSNGTVQFSLHGRKLVVEIPTVKRPDGVYEGRFNLTVDDYVTTGNHSAGVALEGNQYYSFNMNQTSFIIYKMNTTIGAVPTPQIEVNEKENVVVTVNENATGFVLITIGTEEYYKKLDHGVATFNIAGLENGTYNNVPVEYLGDDYFNGNSTKINFVVGPTDDYSITVKVDETKYGENATIYIVIPISASENMTVYVNNTEYKNVTIENGLAIVNASGLAPGHYVVNVTYPGDSIYALKYKNGTEFDVVATDNWILNLEVEAHTYGDYTEFNVRLPDNVANNVNLTIDGANHTVTLTNGAGNLRLNNLSGGMHTVIANYTGDSRYVAKTNSTNFLIEKATSTIILTQSGENVIATITTNATGSVTFYVNGKIYSIDISGNTAVLENKLTIGNNSIVAVYDGDINFTESKNSTNITVEREPAFVNVTAQNVTYGIDSLITVRVPTAQTGYVTITVNDTLINVTLKINNGIAEFNASGLDVGRYVVNVTYLGDETYGIEENSTEFNITKASLDASVIAQNATVKENAGFVITVNDFSGKVNVTVGGVSYYDGEIKSLITISKLHANTYTANLTFYGNDNYNNETVLVDFNVSRVTPTVNVTINDVTYPGTAKAIVDVSDYASGTINITIGDAYFTDTITGGHVEITLGTLSGGVKEAIVNFTSSDEYNFNATANAKFEVIKANSTIVLTQEGSNVIANVTSGATGNVTFFVDGKKYAIQLNNNIATLEDVLTTGNHTVVAIYSGDANYTSSFNATNDTVDLEKAYVNVTAATVTYGNDSLITVKVPKVQNGYVRVQINGTEIDVILKINDGIAEFNASGLNAGKYKADVTYLGDASHGIRENSTLFNVNKADLTASAIAQNVTVKENASFVVTVNDINGRVNVTVGGVSYYDGEIKSLITISKLPANAYTADLTFYGNDNYNNKTIHVDFTVSRTAPTVNVSVSDATYPNSPKATVKVSDGAKGTVNITVGTKTYSKQMTNGEVEIELDNLDAGVKEAIVNFYTGDDYNLDANATYKFVIGKAASTIKINVTPNDLYAGDDALINITVSCTGEVNVYIDGEKVSRTLNNNIITIDVTDLSVGKHTIVVDYPGDNNYNSSSASASFNVNQLDSKVNVTVEDTSYKETAQITVQTPIAQRGYVTITINNENYTEKLENGVAKFNITGLKVGKYAVNVTYLGDENYASIGNSTTFNVTKIDLDPTVIAVNVTKSINATFIIVVPDEYAGKVNITVDGESYSGDVQSIIKMAVLQPGDKVANVKFYGDSNYNDDAFDVKFTVSKSDSSMVVTEVANSSSVVVSLPDDAAGNVTAILPDGSNVTAKVENGIAVIDLSSLAPGQYNVTVEYSGDGNYSNATSKLIVSIPKYESPISVNASEITQGETVAIRVELPLNATGNVTVTIDGVAYTTDKITDGVATFSIDNLTAGDKTIAVEYSGDDNYIANYTISSFTVKADKAISEMHVVDQGNGTVVAVVSNNATGNVTVKVGDKTFTGKIVDGEAIINLDNVTSGVHEIEVFYPGDDTHTNATVTTRITIKDEDKLDAPISIDAGDIKVGDIATIVVSVVENATGNVTIEINGQNYTQVISKGKATFNVENLTAGVKTVAVTYEGSDKYNANFTTGQFEVSKRTPSISVNSTSGNVGEDITITVTTPDDLTRPVLVDVDGVGYYVNITDGKGTLAINGLESADYTAVATYLGDEKYAPANASTTFKVSDVNTTDFEVKVENITVGDKAVIEISAPIDATGNVTVTVDGKSYNVSVAQGKGTLVIPDLSAGNYTVDARYAGDEKYRPANASGTFKVSKRNADLKVIDQGNGTVVVVVADDAIGDVNVKVGNKVYTAQVKDGIATVTLTDAEPGSHEIEVTYFGDENYEKSTIKSIVEISKITPSISVSVSDINVGDKAIITVDVPNAEGSVEIEIDGVKYQANLTDGTATFEIENLTDGDKSVFAVYEGNDRYESNFNSTQFSVSKVKANINVEIKDIDAGENLTVVVTLPNDATGQVLIDIDGEGYYVNVTNGLGIREIPYLANGTYNVVVTYTGDAKYMSSSDNASVNVTKVESYVIPTAINITAGEVEVIKLTLPEDATGTVTVIIEGIEYDFDLDDDTLSSSNETGGQYTVAIYKGYGELVVAGLTKGEYLVTAYYNGDEKYLPCSNTTQFTVNESTSDVKIDDTGNGTVVVELPKNANGNATVVIDGVNSTATVVNGTVNINLDNATPGKHNISVVYTDTTGKEYVINSTVDVPKYQTPMSIEVSDAKVGENVTVVVTVPDGVTGDIALEIDGKQFTAKVKNGKAEFVLPGLSEGGKTIIVKYGSDEYYVANMTTTQFKVSKVNSTIKATSKDITVGKDETITVSVPEGATGRVLVTINGVGYYGTIVNGKAKIVIPELGKGTYKVTITYEGDEKFLPSTTTTTFTVKGGKSSSMSVSADDIVEGEDANIIVDVPEKATGDVTIHVGGKTYTKQVKNGKAKFTVPGLTKGKYVIKAHYSGDKIYNPTDDMGSITVKANGTNPHGNNGSDDRKQHVSAASEGLSLSEYATNIPIWVLLIAILSIGSVQIRRFKK